jgi:hypothetical protein
VAYYITAVHFEGGTAAQHIAAVRWLNAAQGISNTSTVASMIAWIDSGNEAYVGGPTGRVRVAVVRPQGKAAYLRTFADSQWTDNLDNLPRY